MKWYEIISNIIFDGPHQIRIWSDEENDYTLDKPWDTMSYEEREKARELEVKYIYSIIDSTANGPQAVTIIELSPEED